MANITTIVTYSKAWIKKITNKQSGKIYLWPFQCLFYVFQLLSNVDVFNHVIIYRKKAKLHLQLLSSKFSKKTKKTECVAFSFVFYIFYILICDPSLPFRCLTFIAYWWWIFFYVRSFYNLVYSAFFDNFSVLNNSESTLVNNINNVPII